MSHYLHGIDLADAKEALADFDELVPPFSETDEDGSAPTFNDAVAKVRATQDATEAAASAPAGSSLVPFTDAPDLDQRQPSKRDDAILMSEIAGVSDGAWTAFVKALKVAEVGAVSAQGALGLFELKPKRLADLNLMVLRRGKSPTGRHVVWQGDFVPPLTREVFMAKPRVQYLALVASMKRYVSALRDGTIPPPDGGVPKGISLSGILAILHKCGPNGLNTWNDVEDRFPSTVTIFNKCNGLF